MPSVQDILTKWGVPAPQTSICNPKNLALLLQKFSFSEAAHWFDITGSFAGDCEIWLNPGAFPPGAKTPLAALSPAQPKHGVKIIALAPMPRLQIFIGGADCRIFTGAVPW